MKRECKTCDCYEPKPRKMMNYALNPDIGECRIESPNDGGWPRVHEQDWCCQWVQTVGDYGR